MYSDFEDGIKLINLLEILSKEEIGKYNKTPKMKIHKQVCVSAVLEAQGP